jgi:hypothetical protein
VSGSDAPATASLTINKLLLHICFALMTEEEVELVEMLCHQPKIEGTLLCFNTTLSCPLLQFVALDTPACQAIIGRYSNVCHQELRQSTMEEFEEAKALRNQGDQGLTKLTIPLLEELRNI